MRDRRRTVLALVALWFIVMGAASFASGCYGHNCDGDALVWGRNVGEGELIDANTWESNPIDGPWLQFTKQRTWFFEMRELGNRTPEIIIPYISAEPNPHLVGANWTIGAGNLAEQSGSGPGIITIRNDTCADYYLRLVVQTSPRPAPAASPPADASTGDALTIP